MCGKNPPSCLPLLKPSGSPPRVREKQKARKQRLKATGITPACAGKTIETPFYQVVLWDHPRVCGKNVMLYSSNLRLLGSPPRVREEHADHGCSAERQGITPACAGKTHKLLSMSGANRDHPRVCGKNSA